MDKISDIMQPNSLAMRDLLTNEIPPELNKILHEGSSPSANARMMGFAFGGILEHYEDDYDSEDSDYLNYLHQ